MAQPYTQDTMVSFLYRETSAAETDAIQHALDTDFEQGDRFDRLKESVEALDCRLASPRQSTIDDLLRYSRNTAPLETTH